MAFDRIILELQNQVLELSDQVKELSARVSELEAQGPAAKTSKQKNSKIRGTISKNQLVDSIRSALAGKIPAAAIRKGTRQEGYGVVIADKIRLCLRGSGYYGKEDVSKEMKYTGFSTLKKAAIVDDDDQMKFDFYVFGVNHSDDPQQPQVDFFVFSADQFQKVLAKKRPSGKDAMYYFYFGRRTDGRYVDDRERDLDVSEEHANWNPVVARYEQLNS